MKYFIKALEMIRVREKSTHARVQLLEDQLQDARMQLIMLEERATKDQGAHHTNEAEASKKFRYFL